MSNVAELAGEVVGDFRRLRKLVLDGDGSSTLFASMSVTCNESLEELSITEAIEFVGEVRGDLPRLRVVMLNGRDALTWFSSISERCAPTLERVTLRGGIVGLLNRNPTDVPGNFERLKNFHCRGWTLSGCRMKPVDCKEV
eukprot:GHVU01128819.1.p2 GENE.GHVU01128819.1~~GHVU01128819.1.p2  ORF type:complete len:160 (+),score=21.89 GHVU01128819.1:58-480(+)